MNKLVIIFVILLSLLSACAQNNTVNMQEARILICGGHGITPCILEISFDGVLKATSGDIGLQKTDGTLDGEQYFADDAKTKTKKLSEKDCKIIDELITEVKNNCSAEDNSLIYGEDITIVSAFVDNVEYMSLYDEGYGFQNHINKELRNLALKLVELSPLKP